MRRIERYLAAALLLGLLLAMTTGANRSAKGYYTHYDMRLKGVGADSVDTAITYFAKAGSLTANVDSSVGSMRYVKFINKRAANILVRVYHRGGVFDAGTDSAYTLVTLMANAAAANDGSVWENPQGMDVVAIRVMTDPVDATPLRWEAGR